MSTASKLLFGFGLLLLMLIGIGLFVSQRLASVERALATIMAVQEPATATAYEMALNVSATSAAVLAHTGTGEPAQRLRVAANQATFGNLVTRYNQIALSPASRELGERIRVTHGELAALGDSLMTLSDQERAAAADFVRRSDALQNSLARDVRERLDGRGRDGMRKLAEATRLEADLSGMGEALGLYLNSARRPLRERVLARAEDFRVTFGRLAQLRIEDSEGLPLDRLRSEFSALLVVARDAMDLADGVAVLRSRFVTGASRLERVVDDGIHSLARNDLVDAQASARNSIHIAIIAVLVLLVAGILVGSLTAVPVGRSIVRAENALRERMEELAVATARKDEFLGVLGHELRNPLAPLTNSLHMLDTRDGELPDDVRRAHRVMRRQVENMTRLVDDLLDVSRISQGKITLRREPVNLTGLLAQTAEDLRPLAETQGAAFTVAVPGDRLWVDADPTRVAQMVANLLHNAIKYSSPNGRIGIELRQDSGQAVVRVTDNGLGIPAEMIEKIFEPFNQVDPSLTRAHGGLGIGLTLVRRLAHMHGGSVTAESAGKGEGSTFTLRLPLIVPPQLPANAPQRDKAGAATHRRRVLVVDDNRDAANTLADLLRMWGHEVVLAYDGAGALQRASEFRPELALLDIGLPDLDGYKVAERLRKESADGRVLTLIALTGLGQQEDRERALAAGFDQHLTKPVNPAKLKEMLSPAVR
jgi:signal transduction histidine kinase/CheY-like chemotaxis protein